MGDGGKKDLFQASRDGDELAVSQLLAKGANFDEQDEAGWTALMHAATTGHAMVVQQLLDEGANVKILNVEGLNALWKAVLEGNGFIVSQLLAKEPSLLNEQNKDGWTALMFASDENHPAVAQVLLEHGARHDIVCDTGWTALMIASDSGHESIVAQLLENVADKDFQDKESCTALIRAAKWGHSMVARYLLEFGADSDVADNDGKTALILASESGDEYIVSQLLENDAKPDLQDKDGCTALMHATSCGHAMVVRLLLECGADPDVADNDGKTPLMLAADEGLEFIVSLLLDNDANTDIRDKNGWTALMFAARSGHYGIVAALLRRRAKKGLINKNGETARDIARNHRHWEIYRLLSPPPFKPRPRPPHVPVFVPGGEGLNDEQTRAVTSPDENQLVVAGAGTGKTKVLTHRIAWLIRNGIAEPEKIMAVTFTNNAANEMKERVKSLASRDVSSMWIGTFHALGRKILLENSDAIPHPCPSSLDIAEEDQQKRIIRTLLAEHGQNYFSRDVNKRFYEISKHKEQWIDKADGGRDVDDYEFLERYNGRLLCWCRCKRTNYLVEGKDQLECTRCGFPRSCPRKENEIDFNDIMNTSYALLTRNPDIRRKYVFSHVLVDEFQDASPSNYTWLKLFNAAHRAPKYFAVGDPDQSIYGFRNASPRIITNDFPEDFGVTPLELVKNHRSGSRILELANRFKTSGSALQPALGADSPTGYVTVPTKFTSKNKEAEFVADEIAKLLPACSSIGVLCRRNSQKKAISEEMENRKIPCRVHGSGVFSKLDEEPRSAGGVNVMTVHAAKGLEFDAVFVVGVNTGTFPDPRSSLEEEERVMHVAVTRAKHRLYVSSYRRPSSFFNDALDFFAGGKK